MIYIKNDLKTDSLRGSLYTVSLTFVLFFKFIFTRLAMLAVKVCGMLCHVECFFIDLIKLQLGQYKYVNRNIDGTSKYAILVAVNVCQ